MPSPPSAVVARWFLKSRSNRPRRDAWRTTNGARCIVSAKRSDAPNMIAISSLKMTREISRLFPGCPTKVAQTIAEQYGARRGSGRVGLEEEALNLAVVAFSLVTATTTSF